MRLVSAPVAVRDHVLAAAPTLGDARLVCIDGPSGSGKTTLVERLVRIAPATVLHTDELCPGWDGLPQVPEIVAAVLAELAEGRPATYTLWDWIRERPGEQAVIEPAPLVVVEGVGSGGVELAPWTTTLVWMEAAHDTRHHRAMERDGDYFRDQWSPWAEAERAHFLVAGLPGRADLRFRT